MKWIMYSAAVIVIVCGGVFLNDRFGVFQSVAGSVSEMQRQSRRTEWRRSQIAEATTIVGKDKAEFLGRACDKLAEPIDITCVTNMATGVRDGCLKTLDIRPDFRAYYQRELHEGKITFICQ